MKAHVDKEGCIGCALCVDVCPQVFELDEEGLSQPIEGEIPENIMEKAEEARDVCPVSVISLK